MDKMKAEAILPPLSFERVGKTALANAELIMGDQVIWESDKGNRPVRYRFPLPDCGSNQTCCTQRGFPHIVAL